MTEKARGALRKLYESTLGVWKTGRSSVTRTGYKPIARPHIPAAPTGHGTILFQFRPPNRVLPASGSEAPERRRFLSLNMLPLDIIGASNIQHPALTDGMNKKSMKILHVCETAIGGVSTYLQNFDSHTPDRVSNVFLFPMGHAQGLPESMSYSTFSSEKRSLKSIYNMLALSRRMLRETKPDIVFFHSTFSLAALAFLRLTGWRGKAVYVAHSWAISRYENKEEFKARCVRLIEGNLCGLADLVLNIGRSDERLARTLGYKGIHKTLENAVIPAERLAQAVDRPSIDPTKLNLLFVGRFDRQKGLDILLNAFRRATELRSDLALHVVGAKVRNDGGDISIPDGVSLSGWAEKSSMDSWYSNADALIVPSRWEGLPLVIPEAQRNGTPVICSRRSAMEELIEDQVSGYSFELTEDDLFELLVSLRKSSLQKMRSDALKSYERDFTIEVWREKLAVILDEIIDG